MNDSETVLIIARVLSDGLVQLDKEATHWAPDPFEAKPTVSVGRAMDMLRSALTSLDQMGKALDHEFNESLNNVRCELTGAADRAAIERAVAKILELVRGYYRIEYQLAQVTPPRLLEDCFRQFKGVGRRYAGKLRNVASDLEEKAQDPAKTGVTNLKYTLGFEPNVEQLTAEFNRVNSIIQEVARLKH